MTTVIPFCIAELSVGQRAAASVAETSRMFAPLVIAAWIAGICEAGVAAVPLVSVPLSFSAFSAAIAPPDLALSEVVKYELPRFFGITKTFRPFFSGAGGTRATVTARQRAQAEQRKRRPGPKRSLLERTSHCSSPFHEARSG